MLSLVSLLCVCMCVCVCLCVCVCVCKSPWGRLICLIPAEIWLLCLFPSGCNYPQNEVSLLLFIFLSLSFSLYLSLSLSLSLFIYLSIYLFHPSLPCPQWSTLSSPFITPVLHHPPLPSLLSHSFTHLFSLIISLSPLSSVCVIHHCPSPP